MSVSCCPQKESLGRDFNLIGRFIEHKLTPHCTQELVRNKQEQRSALEKGDLRDYFVIKKMTIFLAQQTPVVSCEHAIKTALTKMYDT